MTILEISATPRPKRNSESAAERERRLAWACRRGMRELDFLLTAFLERRYQQLSAPEQSIFEDLLTYSDPLLYDYLMGQRIPADPAIHHVIQQIQRVITA